MLSQRQILGHFHHFFTFTAILLAVRCDASSLTKETPTRSRNDRHHPSLPVLGYVTPWNSRGKQLVEDFRNRFDIVCPVWYTVHASTDPASPYEVRGGPTNDDDDVWYKRLQEPLSPSASIQITPRFFLDDWNADDYQQLLFNETRWALLSESILQVVEDKGYDGVVFESGATHALSPSLAVLSDGLHRVSKKLIVVMHSLRGSHGDPSIDSMILESLPHFAGVADYISIMTYDMFGPGGRASTRSFPPGSSLQTAQADGKVREPGPNTNGDWVKQNLKDFTAALNGQLINEVYDMADFKFGEEVSHKLLMGLPLYGYTYPVVFVNSETGTIARTPSSEDGWVTILKGPGDPIVMTKVEELLQKSGTELQETEDGQSYFDYVQDDAYRRAFVPTASSMAGILGILGRYENIPVGVALWEVGQGSATLLETL